MTAANWPLVIDFTLEEEGGLSNDPADPGGLTNFGISQRAYPDVDVRNLTRDGAIAIYRRDYWARIHGDQLPAGVDLMVFDMAVNAGMASSAKVLQRCLGVDADGVIGETETLPAALAADAGKLIATLRAAQLALYESLPGWHEFGAGWGGRVARRAAKAYWMLTLTTS